MTDDTLSTAERLQQEFLRVGFKKIGSKTFRGTVNDFKGRTSSAKRELTIKLTSKGTRVWDCFFSTIKNRTFPPLVEYVDIPAEKLIGINNFDDFFNLVVSIERN